jgi:uncharacterized protein YodC (DUF2158 family)
VSQSKFSIGDVVRAKSGGALMIVRGIEFKGSEETGITGFFCEWCEHDNFTTALFNGKSLDLYRGHDETDEAVRQVYENEKQLQTRINEIHQRWANTPYLDGACDPKARSIAMLLENQANSIKYEKNKLIKKHGLNVAAEVYRDFIGFDLVSIQPLLGPTGDIYYQYPRWEEDENDANSLGPIFCMHCKTKEVHAQTVRILGHFFETEESYVQILAKSIQRSMLREIINSIRKNAKMDLDEPHQPFNSDNDCVLCLKDLTPERFRRDLEHAVKCLQHQAWSVDVMWCIVGKYVAQRLALSWSDEMENNHSDVQRLQVRKLYHHNCYYDPTLPAAEVLFGSDTTQGLIYSPFETLCSTPLSLDSENKAPDDVVFLRRAKHLVSGKPYAKLTYRLWQR